MDFGIKRCASPFTLLLRLPFYAFYETNGATSASAGRNLKERKSISVPGIMRAAMVEARLAALDQLLVYCAWETDYGAARPNTRRVGN